MSIRAMNWAREAMKGARLTSSERLVLFVLALHHHDKTNACNPAVATVAEIVGLSERRTQMAVRRLVDRGLIGVSKRTERGRQRSNQHELFGQPRGAKNVPPNPKSRGDKKSAPHAHNRGVTPPSPDKDPLTLKEETQIDVVVAFPLSMARI